MKENNIMQAYKNLSYAIFKQAKKDLFSEKYSKFSKFFLLHNGLLFGDFLGVDSDFGKKLYDDAVEKNKNKIKKVEIAIDEFSESEINQLTK